MGKILTYRKGNMLVFLYIILFFLGLNLIVFFSSIKFEIEKLKIDTTQKAIIKELKVNIYLVFLKRIKYLKYSLNKEKISKVKGIKYFKKITEQLINTKKYKNFKENGLIEKASTILNALKNTNMNVEKFELKINLGLENIIVLSYIVAIINILVSVFIGKKTFKCKQKFLENYSFLVNSKQTEENYINIVFSTEITLKISNIVKNIL